MRTMTSVLACVALAGAATADLNLVELKRIDLSGQFGQTTPNGTSIGAVAWDGSSAWVAGFNNAGAGASAGIFRVSDALGAHSIGGTFGSLATPALRGYSGLDIKNGRLVAAYDNGGASANGIASWDVATQTQNWAKNARGSSGVAYDPGFNGADEGVAWTTFGSGRRALQNAATGADIYTTANGMIINDGAGTFWRGIDFDDATGNLYARRSNGLIKTTRTGGNSGVASTLVAFNAAADFVSGHNLAFMGGTVEGDVILFNDRLSAASGQGFLSVMKAVTSSGAAVTLDWTLLSPVADGNGYYSFSYHAASQTLAVADFANNTLHIFAVPAPGAAGLLGLAGLAALRRRR
ncbi:MAG: hypothetical protein HRU70_13565 [Phycisphaeraceae bacterium]|nr:MAG: hypothetical protein HRU70_13565 [Phycisphaeraceae bacterium]